MGERLFGAFRAARLFSSASKSGMSLSSTVCSGAIQPAAVASEASNWLVPSKPKF